MVSVTYLTLVRSWVKKKKKKKKKEKKGCNECNYLIPRGSQCNLL
jgi:hypothetical protein